MSHGSYLNCGRDFLLAWDLFVYIVSLGNEDSCREWSTSKKRFVFLCYSVTKILDVLLFYVQTYYSSKLGIPKDTSLEFKVQHCAHLCLNSLATWTLEFLHLRKPFSALGGGENPVPMIHQMRHDLSLSLSWRSFFFLTFWPLSTTSLLMNEHTGSYTLGRVPRQTVQPFRHAPICSILSP